jgi:hypothetical protein
VSDLWDSCREVLRERVAADVWARYIAPLAGWVDDGTLYLWVDRDDDDWAASTNPARELDREIREVTRCAVVYLDQPVDREAIIAERGIREVRERRRDADVREHAVLMQYAREELVKLGREAPGRRMTAVRLREIAMDRARSRREREKGSAYGLGA